MPNEAWADFIAIDNVCAQKLLAHFCALQLLLRPVFPKVRHGSIGREPLPAMTTWIRQLSDNIARLSELHTPISLETNATILGRSDSDSAYKADVSPKSSSSSSNTSSVYDFVPLQIANQWDLLDSKFTLSEDGAGTLGVQQWLEIRRP